MKLILTLKGYNIEAVVREDGRFHMDYIKTTRQKNYRSIDSFYHEQYLGHPKKRRNDWEMFLRKTKEELEVEHATSERQVLEMLGMKRPELLESVLEAYEKEMTRRLHKMLKKIEEANQ